MIKLRLYIVGQTPRSQETVGDLKKVFGNGTGAGGHSFDVIDLLTSPEAAELDAVFATPTLVKFHPLPVRKLIGDFSNRDGVLSCLDLT
ncbi:circadian clock KaiB family protein [Thermodesulfobacteriota bacterium]